jgi:hypothetical protein
VSSEGGDSEGTKTCERLNLEIDKPTGEMIELKLCPPPLLRERNMQISRKIGSRMLKKSRGGCGKNVWGFRAKEEMLTP